MDGVYNPAILVRGRVSCRMPVSRLRLIRDFASDTMKAVASLVRRHARVLRNIGGMRIYAYRIALSAGSWNRSASIGCTLMDQARFGYWSDCIAYEDRYM